MDTKFIVSAIGELPDADTAAARLLRNQDHIGDAVKPPTEKPPVSSSRLCWAITS